MNNIILKLQGGLGNQMFQYAFGRKIQLDTGARLIIDISDFKYDKAGRQYALQTFNINKNIILDRSGKFNIRYDQRNNWIIKLFVKFAPNLLLAVGSKIGIYIWEKVEYKNININNNFLNIYIHGLWQSEMYFYPIRDIIKQEFQVLTSVSQSDEKLIQEINSVNSVCIHIRRGDFLYANNNLTVCDLNYYKKAVGILERKIENPYYYIFSDDIRWVQENLVLSKKHVKYIDDARKDYEEFRLMYNCKNFIISNSTFSWWASYLRTGTGMVIAPKQWYTDNTDISCLIRKDMLCI